MLLVVAIDTWWRHSHLLLIYRRNELTARHSTDDAACWLVWAGHAGSGSIAVSEYVLVKD